MQNPIKQKAKKPANSGTSDLNPAAAFLKNLSNGMILCIGLFLMAVGISLSIIFGKDADLTGKLLIALVTELGFAFFIAWVIICTVDEREKMEHAKKVEKDERRIASKLYVNAVLDLDLPESVSSELSSYISGSSLLKEYQTIVMRLEKCGNFTKLTQYFEAVFTNVDKSSVDWTPTFDSYDNRIPTVEDQHPDGKWGFQRSEIYKRRSGRKDWTPLSSTSPEELEKERKIELCEPITIEPGEQVKVMLEQVCSKYGSDNELFTSKLLTRNLNLEVSYDPNDFEVLYRAIHPQEDFSGLNRVDSSDRITFGHPFLPSHGFVVWWRPK